MALEIFVGQNAALTASTGTVDFTSADSTTTPVAALHMLAGATVNNSPRNQANCAFGMADGTSEFCVSIGVNNNVTPTDTTRGRAVAALDIVSPGGSFTEGRHSHTSFIAGGERLTSSNGFAVARLAQSMFFAGCNVSVEEVALSATVDVAANVDPGFAWDLVIVTHANISGATYSNDAEISFGFMTPADDSQGCIMWHSNNAATPSAPVSQISTTYAGGQLNDGVGTLVYGIDVQAGTGTSCDVYPRIAGGAVNNVQLLFIGFTDSSAAKIVSWTTPTSTGSSAVTGAGFTPVATIDLFSYATAYDTATTGASGGAWGVGFGTGDSQFCAALADEASPASLVDAQTLVNNIAVSVPIDDGTTSASTSLKATHTSYDSDGWTRNWTEVDTGSGRKCLTLAIGSPSTAAGNSHTMGRGIGRGIGRRIG